MQRGNQGTGEPGTGRWLSGRNGGRAGDRTRRRDHAGAAGVARERSGVGCPAAGRRAAAACGTRGAAGRSGRACRRRWRPGRSSRAGSTWSPPACRCSRGRKPGGRRSAAGPTGTRSRTEPGTRTCRIRRRPTARPGRRAGCHIITTTMCSICGIVSVPAGSRGSGSEPGRRSHVSRDAAGRFGLFGLAPAPAPGRRRGHGGRECSGLQQPAPAHAAGVRRLILCHAGEFCRAPGWPQGAADE